VGFSFRPLDAEGPEELYGAFMEAFSDYAVPVTATFDDFRTMHRRRGVSYAASVGAYDGGRLAGFVFNGTGTWRGAPCAYDAGTGVLPAWRGRGLTAAMASASIETLGKLGFGSWLLEVLVGNEKAHRAYLKAGFRETRRFACPEGTVVGPEPPGLEAEARAGVRVLERAARDVAAFASWRDWEPSWQNSDESLARNPEPMTTLVAFEDGNGGRGSTPGEPVGYVVATRKGSVAQLAVRPDRRRRGVGRALVSALAARSGGAVRYVNVQADDRATLGLFASFGIGAGVEQREMELRLAGGGEFP